jgi:hypothetical protein
MGKEIVVVTDVPLLLPLDGHVITGYKKITIIERRLVASSISARRRRDSDAAWAVYDADASSGKTPGASL